MKICGIYKDRPEVCRKYPTVDHYQPAECTFYFAGSERRGDCACGESVCCSIPREHGEPGGAPLPAEAGGEPCKHIVEVADTVKEAAVDEEISSQGDAFGELERALGH